MRLLAPPGPATLPSQGEGAEGTFWLQQLCGRGGVPVPSCAQAQRVSGGAEPGEMLM